MPLRQTAQLSMNEWNKPLECGLISVTPRQEKQGDLIGRGCRHAFLSYVTPRFRPCC